MADARGRGTQKKTPARRPGGGKSREKLYWAAAWFIVVGPFSSGKVVTMLTPYSGL